MRLLWGLLLVLALAASPLLALVLLVIIVAFIRPFRRREYGHPSVTLRGELVRSNSERMIADWFSRNGIRYVYEYPAPDRRGLVISRPDFYLPDYGVYVEYWGLVGLKDGQARLRYERGMVWKIERYRTNEVRVISLYPNDLKGLGDVFNHRLVKAYEMSTARILR